MRAILCLFLSLSLFFSACKQVNQENIIPNDSAVIGLNSPWVVEGQRMTILTQDYFIDPSAIDSIVSPVWELTLSADKSEFIIEKPANQTLPAFSWAKVYVHGFPYAFLIKSSSKQAHYFTYPSGDDVKTVSVLGDMTNWQAIPLKKDKTSWNAVKYLYPGSYQYQFEVNGERKLDPSNPVQVSNGFGGFNSSITLKKGDPNKLPRLYTKSHQSSNIEVQAIRCTKRPLVFFDNFLLGDEQLSFSNETLTISLPADAKQQKRSFLRLWAENEEGVSNDLLIPLNYGEVLDESEDLERMDKEAMVMYFPLVDRFNNGDSLNDDPLDDDRLLPLTNFMGGDLKGITQKIKSGYFKDLGTNTIWLSPITQNPLTAFQEFIEPQRFYSGYHGYWPIYSNVVDHRFGTNEDLKELVEVAHENDMNVLLDYICNHVHEQHQIYQKHPEWATELNLPDGRKNLRLWDEQRLTTWFDTFLPSLDLSNPEAIDVQSDSAMFWIKEYGLDGFRQDASKHVPLEFWRTLTRKLKDEVIIPQNRPIYQIGETYASNELISTYISSGLLDAQFDFNLSGTAKNVFIQDGNSLEGIATALENSFEFFGYHHSMGNITGNHDQPRFMGYAGGDLQYDENDREAGFQRDIVVKDTRGYQKLQTMTAFLMTIPGIPVIYYGDEIGMVGGNDPDNRRMMEFDGLNEYETATKKNAQALGQLRKEKLVFVYGDFEILKSSKDQLVYARNYFGKTAIIAISKGKDQNIEVTLPERFNTKELKAQLDQAFSIEGRSLKLSVPADGYQILFN